MQVMSKILNFQMVSPKCCFFKICLFSSAGFTLLSWAFSNSVVKVIHWPEGSAFCSGSGTPGSMVPSMSVGLVVPGLLDPLTVIEQCPRVAGGFLTTEYPEV